MNVFIIGVGLIGGSMVLDIQKEYTEAVIYGIDLNDNNLTEAIELGVIHKKATFADLEIATVVIVSIPVDAQLEVIPKVLDHINDHCLVIDVGSTKQQICKVLENHPKRRNFLAGHPIAGTEFSGPSAAITGLFKNKTNIICEVEKTAFKLQETALEIFAKLGMRIRYMDAVSHDKHIFDMAGSGFASTVRLAKSSPAMWTPIFKQNKENILETLEEYISNLKHFKELMEQDNFSEIYNEMENTNYIKQILNGIK
jgi:prephenate dehydrogenase